MKLKLLLLSAFISLAGTAHAQRIVVLTPDTADIVAALGALDEIVGRDHRSKSGVEKQAQYWHSSPPDG